MSPPVGTGNAVHHRALPGFLYGRGRMVIPTGAIVPPRAAPAPSADPADPESRQYQPGHAQIAAQSLNDPQPHHAVHTKQDLRATILDGLNEAIGQERLQQCRMQTGTPREFLQGELLRLDADAGERKGGVLILYPFISSRGLKRDSAASFSKRDRSFSVRVGGMTSITLTY